MAIEQTFSIIKPDAVAKNVIGEIVSRFEKNGLQIVASKMLQLSREQAEGFYAVHRERPFYSDLVSFMISGPVVVQVLEGENAISTYTDLCPPKASPGAIGGMMKTGNNMQMWVFPALSVRCTHCLWTWALTN